MKLRFFHIKPDEIRYGIENLLHKKTRTILSTLSILMGIMAIFALISFGLGIKDYTNTLAQQAGSDKLFMQPIGMMSGGTDFYISKDDVEFVSKIQGVDEITTAYYAPAEVRYGKEFRYVDMMAMDPDDVDFFNELMTIKMEKGRELKDGELNKAVVGYSYMVEEKVFSKKVDIGSKIVVNNRTLEVVGFYGSLGNPQDDMNIYISDDTYESMFPANKDKYYMAMMRAGAGYDASDLADKITEKLRKHKGQDEGEEDFYVASFEDMIASFDTILNIINGVLVLIALVSVIVASINIMNTMYTAVLERTKEIGVMKAIGARNSTILRMFMIEAGLLGLIGGMLGIFAGYLVASLGGAIAAGAGLGLLKPIFPWTLVAGCLLFSFLVGAGAGYLPAKSASEHKPVDSLRYE